MISRTLGPVQGSHTARRECLSGYLVGESFTVADLAASALFTPLLQPPEHHYPPVAQFPEPLRRFRRELARMSGSDWVLEMYRRHRGSSAEVGVTRTPRFLADPGGP